MQGLIADTGGDWRLYKRHHSIGRFADWVFHPFSHLGGSHHSVYEPASMAELGMAGGPVRRLIFVKVSGVTVTKASDAFAVNARRTPAFMVDLDAHSLRVVDLRRLPTETAWGKVPTPSF
jgi:hypothetical protein